MVGKEISTEEALQKLVKRDRYLGVLWERLEDRLSVILEGNDVLERKIDRIDAKLETFKTEANEKFDMLFTGQDELKEGQKKLEEKTDVIENGMKQLLSDNQEFFEGLQSVERGFGKGLGYRV